MCFETWNQTNIECNIKLRFLSQFSIVTFGHKIIKISQFFGHQNVVAKCHHVTEHPFPGMQKHITEVKGSCSKNRDKSENGKIPNQNQLEIDHLAAW